MKKAFTMIEIIFVIVILGILASIAIPKLMGTRTDAHVAVVSQDVGLLYRDLTTASFAQPVKSNDQSYYQSWMKGHTNVFKKYSDDDGYIRLNGCSVDVYDTGEDKKCMTIHLGGCSHDWEVVSINKDTSFCNGLAQTVSSLKYTEATRVVF